MPICTQIFQSGWDVHHHTSAVTSVTVLHFLPLLLLFTSWDRYWSLPDYNSLLPSLPHNLGKFFVDFRVTGGPGQPRLVLVFPDTPTSPYTPRVLGLVWFFFCNNFNWIQPSSKGYTLLENKAISLITCLTSAVHLGQCQRAAPSWQGSCMAHSAPASLQNLSVQGH